ncbi:MAG: hypothetical protein ACYDC6_05200 [Acidobacteriaceae bacterium]
MVARDFSSTLRDAKDGVPGLQFLKAGEISSVSKNCWHVVANSWIKAFVIGPLAIVLQLLDYLAELLAIEIRASLYFSPACLCESPSEKIVNPLASILLRAKFGPYWTVLTAKLLVLGKSLDFAGRNGMWGWRRERDSEHLPVSVPCKLLILLDA